MGTVGVCVCEGGERCCVEVVEKVAEVMERGSGGV